MAELRWGRAVWIFCVAYVVVTVLAIGLSVTLGVLGMPTTPQPMLNQAYLLSERFLPGMNLLVWGISAWIYFRGRDDLGVVPQRREAFCLGGFWLAAAVVVDYVGFVLIRNPLSLSPHDFYVGQSPWIYLIYLAIFLGPVFWMALQGFRSAPMKV